MLSLASMLHTISRKSIMALSYMTFGSTCLLQIVVIFSLVIGKNNKNFGDKNYFCKVSHMCFRYNHPNIIIRMTPWQWAEISTSYNNLPCFKYFTCHPHNSHEPTCRSSFFDQLRKISSNRERVIDTTLKHCSSHTIDSATRSERS